VRNHLELFSPFCTRPFVEAAFSVPALMRYTEPLHYGITLQDSALHALPFLEEPWRSCQRRRENVVFLAV